MNVSVSSPQTFSVSLKQSQENTNKVTVINGGVQVPATFGDLIDYNDQNVRDKYVIMYDASSQKYVAVNPDDVLSAASSTELTSPGLPTDFVDTLDVDLDNRIDLDAGCF